MSRVNILKRVKIGARWKLLSIPRNDKGNPNWAALPEGRYFIEWYMGGKRHREFGGTTVAQAPESQKRKRHELEGRHLGLPGFEKAGEHPKNPPLHIAVSNYLDQVETLKKPNTLRKYRAVLDRFSGSLHLPKIDAVHLHKELEVLDIVEGMAHDFGSLPSRPRLRSRPR